MTKTSPTPCNFDLKFSLSSKIDTLAAAHKVLQQNDVLLSFDGIPIDSDGTVCFRDGERVDFSYLVSSKYVNDCATLQVLRGGKKNGSKLDTYVSIRSDRLLTHSLTHFRS